MRVWRVHLALVVIGLLAVGEVLAQGPSIAELQKLSDHGQYPEAIVEANRLLDLTGDLANGIDRAQVLAIKGEAHLQTGGYALAAQAFAAAAKQEHDPAKAAVNKATEVMIRRSEGGIYTARIGSAGSGNAKSNQAHLSSTAERADALPMLFADESALFDAKLKIGRTAQTLEELQPVVEDAETLRQLELAATGKDGRTRQYLSELADHAFNLMDASVTLMNRRVLDISHAALVTVHTDEKVRDPLSPPAIAPFIGSIRPASLKGMSRN